MSPIRQVGLVRLGNYLLWFKSGNFHVASFHWLKLLRGSSNPYGHKFNKSNCSIHKVTSLFGNDSNHRNSDSSQGNSYYLKCPRRLPKISYPVQHTKETKNRKYGISNFSFSFSSSRARERKRRREKASERASERQSDTSLRFFREVERERARS